LATAQFEDGGLTSRSPFEQVLLVDRLGLLRSCYVAAKQTIPDGIEGAAAAALAALHGVTLGDGALSSWQGCNPGEASRLAGLVEGCGFRARRRWRHRARRRRSRSKCRTADNGWSSIAAGRDRCRRSSPTSWSTACARRP